MQIDLILISRMSAVYQALALNSQAVDFFFFPPSCICLNAKAVLERKGSFEVVLRKAPVGGRLQV